MAKLGDLIVRVGADTTNFNAKLGALKSQIKKDTNNIASMGRSLSMSVTAPLALIGASSFQTAADFEQSMAKVQAVSGATADEFAKLESNAKELGRTTRFTASEVSELQLNFAKLGFTAEEITKVTGATLALAQATDSDLATSAEVAGSTLRAFGLSAEETSRVTDVMAKSFSTSALDMGTFADSMKFVAPVAKAAGLSVEETTAMLASLSNAGIKGSQAGTALRRIISELGSTGGDVSGAIQKLANEGLNLADAKDEVGRSAQSALLVLANSTQQTSELTNEFENAQGAAQGMAEIMDNTAQGAMKRMQSALEGAQIEIGTALAPIMIALANIISDLATRFSEMGDSSKTFVLIIGGIAAAIGPLMVIIPSIISGFTMVAGILSGPVVIAIGAVVAAVALIIEHWDEIVEYFTNGNGAKILEQIQTDMQDLGANLVMIWEMATNLIKAYWELMGTDMIESTARSSGGISDITNGMFEFIGNVMGFFTAMMEGDWDNMWKRLANATLGYVQTIIEYVNSLIETTLSTMDVTLGLVGVDVDSAGAFRQVADEAMKLMDSMKFQFEETESAVDEFSEGLDGSSESMKIAEGRGAEFIQSLNTVKRSTDKVTKSTKKQSESIEELGTSFEEILQPITTFQDKLDAMELGELEEFDMAEEIFGDEDEFATAGDNIIAKTQQVTAMISQLGSKMTGFFSNVFQGLLDGSLNFKSMMVNILKDLAIQLASLVATFAILSALTGGAGGAFMTQVGSLKGFLASGFNIPGFADGGIVSGPTMAMVGEYPGARNNPEVIAPLDKLRGMLGGQSVQVTGRLSGRDILLSSEYSNIDRNRIRGY